MILFVFFYPSQGSVSRSKLGWSNDDKDEDDADDFMFSEEPESDSSAPASNR